MGLNSEDIESDGERCRIDSARTDECGGHSGNLAAFSRIDSVLWTNRPGSGCIASLHFDKSERIAIVSDEVDFAIQISDSEVAGDHGVPMSAEIPVGVGFAMNAGAPGALLQGFAGKRLDEAAPSAKLEDSENKPGKDLHPPLDSDRE